MCDKVSPYPVISLLTLTLLQAFDVIEGAFVTFNNEESARRCMDDYRASNISLLRRFQPKQLQFQHVDVSMYVCRLSWILLSEYLLGILLCSVGYYFLDTHNTVFLVSGVKLHQGKHYALRVVRAPEPSNILWENVCVSDGTRILRKSITAFITFILLVASFIIIYLAQVCSTDTWDPPSSCRDTRRKSHLYIYPGCL